MRRWACWTWLACCLSLVAGVAAGSGPGRAGQRGLPESFRQVPSQYYLVATDLPDEELGPILLRLGRMVEEYRRRTMVLSSRADDRRLPFLLFSKQKDYEQAGGAADSAGIFDGERLLAFVGKRADARSWHVIQHEAFHQYLAIRLDGQIPIWLNEGMAEYFGESAFTGDGFISGMIPPWRLQRVQESIRQHKFPPMREFLATSHEQWNKKLSLDNYDQAWSVVQYLAHGENGRNQDALVRYMQLCSRGLDPVETFGKCFGDVGGVEQSWQVYWLSQTAKQCRPQYALTAVQTACSYLGRFAAAREVIGSMDQLKERLAAGTLRQPPQNALPIDLLDEYLKWAAQMGQWNFQTLPRAGEIEGHVTLSLEDGTKVLGRYIVRAGKVEKVEAWIENGKAVPNKGGGRR